MLNEIKFVVKDKIKLRKVYNAFKEHGIELKK